ncbi:hypothetical protein BDY17DRAFT_239529, partial [Neohortaea acidophila]
TYSTSALTYITPSPGAPPVAVTTESQLVTSYLPQFTLCELTTVAGYSLASGAFSGSSNSRFQNSSGSIPTATGTCTTIFSPTETMVCATTLTALATRYTVTACDEELTFSTKLGYALVTASPTASSAAKNATTPATITPAPSIQTVTTYYLAPWQQLTAGTAPSEVDLKVCRSFDNDTTECILEQQVWETSLVTSIATSTTTINISTTIHGNSQLIVETFVANVTEVLTTFSLSTTMELEYQTVYTTTNSANQTTVSTVPASLSTGPTIFETRTLQEASGNATASPSNPPSADGTSTTTIHITQTFTGGTMTVTVQ